ncbi:hypothetical protein CPC08DRAFT_344653 [Agrocybe pediades]|nr:hypothetical protein CPC08DRAFT_344653 [Agrocybe pediades]
MSIETHTKVCRAALTRRCPGHRFRQWLISTTTCGTAVVHAVHKEHSDTRKPSGFVQTSVRYFLQMKIASSVFGDGILGANRKPCSKLVQKLVVVTCGHI